MSAQAPASKAIKKRRDHKMGAIPYFFVLPNFLIFSIFIVVPTIIGFVYSFHEYDGLNPMEFIGFDNYKEIVTNGEFWTALGKTALYALVVVPSIYCLSLAVAMMLIQQIRAKGLFRAVFYWPTMISYIIVGLTWKWIFGDFGVLNYVMTLIGVEPVHFLSDSLFANVSVIIATVWSRLGFFMVIFMAGLQAIPTDFYEAARLDGASKPRVFWNITLPLLKPTTVLVVMLSLIDAFKAYPLLFALTGGGPGKETTYIVQYIYETGFVKQELGMASAMSILLFILISLFTVAQFKLSKGGDN
ncbi:Melibiose/raffinose/stachyose import permease protein MelD [Paenibacillus solanacearum]|uniref:Melibiose/raffinose/stachyose import permease protein MelD n=1 Tax=Paenibacillus solanacearum TaxID=2048548 RepID=A0A916K7W6_9BACL|nr:sugar ABC transporter permease [Paenibacillus solanacearum]CAG7644296.1 Melibiose/raffinose/stachyose import permease protein MelD [Paenibacillus solanacearum]